MTDIHDPMTALAYDACRDRRGDVTVEAPASDLPFRLIREWAVSALLDPKRDYLDACDQRATGLLERELGEAEERVLRALASRPRLTVELQRITGFDANRTQAMLNRLAWADIVAWIPNPAWEGRDSWLLIDPLVRFRYGFLGEHYDKWRRGRITDTLWLRYRHRLHSTVFRPHFYTLARQWLLRQHPDSRPARLVYPDARRQKLLALDIVTVSDDGEVAAMGTGRWRLPLRTGQADRLAYISRQVGYSGTRYRFHSVPPRTETTVTDVPLPSIMSHVPPHSEESTGHERVGR
ncbi:hypothetical protein [Haloglycomyces albus]|uniref:hypothetical protein n=1 Tax=Haloglycomyces albus TaxID=526067 RepID=UPI00046D1276|nr:hypothetical protein [Haloglycomyces albus]